MSLFFVRTDTSNRHLKLIDLEILNAEKLLYLLVWSSEMNYSFALHTNGMMVRFYLILIHCLFSFEIQLLYIALRNKDLKVSIDSGQIELG